MPEFPHIPNASEILENRKKIAPYIHHTPVLSSSQINAKTGAFCYFKTENFQKVGAFKFRGAITALLQLTDEEKQRGVSTHSSGNHGQALAKAAQLLGIKAYVVMPDNSPGVKIAAVKQYGAEVTFCTPNLESREATLQGIIAHTGAVEIHPYNNYSVILGQSSCAAELIENQPQLDYIIAPIGGGGLMSGTLLSTHYFSPKTKVIGAEPLGANDAFQSLKEGKLIPQTNPNTIADGLLTSLGTKTFPIIQQHIDQIITVDDREIKHAMQLIWERMKIIVEPSSATTLAAVLKQRELFRNKKIGLILTGGNVDFKKIPDWFSPA
ncbi:MAG: serine dehydratase [Crocinitomicaceae bacterium]|nr:serine dehydratase [Crocinitomicaceae bacterium]|tara:strand:+ start:16506 stop:17477 length:972 start_codon:yes stop_codon:yes gene_type:complete